MPYLFDAELFDKIGLAFESIIIDVEQVESSAPIRTDYFFLKFTTSVIALLDQRDNKSLITLILKGDKLLTQICNIALNPIASVTIGLRWHGSYHDVKTITILGLAIKINYAENKIAHREVVIQALSAELTKIKFFSGEENNCDQILSALSRTFPEPQNISSMHCFFKPQSNKISSELGTIQDHIRSHISPILPSRIYANESNFNPTYQDIATISCILHQNQKKIWVYRTDGIIAIGNKNANWISFAENSLSEATHHSLHKHIDWNDRYGHPSLAFPYPGYDGSVYYAGLLAQRNGYLEIYLSSGRYNRHDLNEIDQKVLESYIAHQFQFAFGTQPVCFIDSPSDNYYESSHFYYDRPLPEYCERRTYTSEEVRDFFQEKISCENMKHLAFYYQ